MKTSISFYNLTIDVYIEEKGILVSKIVSKISSFNVETSKWDYVALIKEKLEGSSFM